MPSVRMSEICWSLRFHVAAQSAPLSRHSWLGPYSSTAWNSSLKNPLPLGFGHAETDILGFFFFSFTDDVDTATR